MNNNSRHGKNHELELESCLLSLISGVHKLEV